MRFALQTGECNEGLEYKVPLANCKHCAQLARLARCLSQETWVRHARGWSAIEFDGTVNLMGHFGPIGIQVAFFAHAQFYNFTAR